MVAVPIARRAAPALAAAAAAGVVGFLVGRRRRRTPAPLARAEELQAALIRLLS